VEGVHRRAAYLAFGDALPYLKAGSLFAAANTKSAINSSTGAIEGSFVEDGGVVVEDWGMRSEPLPVIGW
jgi:hypothetical protein